MDTFQSTQAVVSLYRTHTAMARTSVLTADSLCASDTRNGNDAGGGACPVRAIEATPLSREEEGAVEE